MKNPEISEYIESLDELSLYLELRKLESTLELKKYNASITVEENPRIREEMKNIKKSISLYEEQIQKFGIQNDSEKIEWKSACREFLNKLSILEYAILIEEKNSNHNLSAFYPKISNESTFLSPKAKEYIREKIKTRKVS